MYEYWNKPSNITERFQATINDDNQIEQEFESWDADETTTTTNILPSVTLKTEA